MGPGFRRDDRYLLFRIIWLSDNSWPDCFADSETRRWRRKVRERGGKRCVHQIAARAGEDEGRDGHKLCASESQEPGEVDFPALHRLESCDTARIHTGQFSEASSASWARPCAILADAPCCARDWMAMAKATRRNITDRVSLERWLRSKDRNWARAIAVRAALRVLPLIAGLELQSGSKITESDFFLAVFRMNARTFLVLLAWFALSPTNVFAQKLKDCCICRPCPACAPPGCRWARCRTP